MAKLGEFKRCRVCGGAAVLRIVQPSLATLAWVTDGSSPYDVPPMPMWQCDECDDLQPLGEELED
jgi:hypothetical protein